MLLKLKVFLSLLALFVFIIPVKLQAQAIHLNGKPFSSLLSKHLVSRKYTENRFRRNICSLYRKEKRFLNHHKKNTDKFLACFDKHQHKVISGLCNHYSQKSDGLLKTYFISNLYLNRQIQNLYAGKNIQTETIYDPYHDSLKTLAAFYSSCPKAFKNKKTKRQLAKLNALMLQSDVELKRTGLVKQYMRSRKLVFSFLKDDTLYTNAPNTVQKHYRLLKEDAFYYVARQQNEQQLVIDKIKNKQLTDKLQERLTADSKTKVKKTEGSIPTDFNNNPIQNNIAAIEPLKKVTLTPLTEESLTTAFAGYFKSNSKLSVFNNGVQTATTAQNTAGGYEQSLQGLQTNAQVKQSLTNTVNQYGSNGETMLKQGIDKGLEQLAQLKRNYTGITNAADVPDFKPNHLKTIRPQQRITKSYTLQFNAAQYGVPMGVDVGLKIGYLLTERTEVGIGSSTKAGFGQNIEHWKFSWPGYGIQSYATCNLLGAIHMYGGYERNFYDNITVREQPEKNYTKDAAVTGIELRSNTKKGKSYGVQLLYDFLAHKNLPVTNHLIFRTNYKF